MQKTHLKNLLNQAYLRYNNADFIEHDPVLIPHMFTAKNDIEIMGFFAAVFAWGQRTTIINKCKELIDRMDHSPYEFIVNHSDTDLKKLLGFKHRTFNDTDLLYFVAFLHHWYSNHDSLESAFTSGMSSSDATVEHGLNTFKRLFFSLPDYPDRTLKHIASPAQHSSCKRLNMFLRWMVRTDASGGVDFGIWKHISPSQLVCPLDVHVQRVALMLGLMDSPKTDWQAAIQLTETLKQFDSNDPVKYDFALFGLGVNGEF